MTHVNAVTARLQLDGNGPSSLPGRMISGKDDLKKIASCNFHFYFFPQRAAGETVDICV